MFLSCFGFLCLCYTRSRFVSSHVFTKTRQHWPAAEGLERPATADQCVAGFGDHCATSMWQPVRPGDRWYRRASTSCTSSSASKWDYIKKLYDASLRCHHCGVCHYERGCKYNKRENQPPESLACLLLEKTVSIAWVSIYVWKPLSHPSFFSMGRCLWYGRGSEGLLP